MHITEKGSCKVSNVQFVVSQEDGRHKFRGTKASKSSNESSWIEATDQSQAWNSNIQHPLIEVNIAWGVGSTFHVTCYKSYMSERKLTKSLFSSLFFAHLCPRGL